MIEIGCPFPRQEYELAWAWINEFRESHIDDYGPQSFPDFVVEMDRRTANGEWLFEIVKDGEPCGIVGYAPMTGRWGCFHGICFARGKTTRAERREAVRNIIQQLFLEGAEKISASYFASNQKIHHFLADLGAIEEGYLRSHTVRNGQPIDMRLVAFFRN